MGDNIENTFMTWGCQRVLKQNIKLLNAIKLIDQLQYIKIKSLYSSKGTIQGVKMQTRVGDVLNTYNQ